MGSTDVCKSVLHPFKSLYFFLYVLEASFIVLTFPRL